MHTADKLLIKFLDDRESLSEEEFQQLADLLRQDESLAIELKQQLVLEELLAERLAVDRRDFTAQVHQRIYDLERGEDELQRQIEDVRSLAAAEIGSRTSRARAARWLVLAGTVAAALAVVVGLRFLPPLLAPELLAIVDNTHGAARLIRDGREQTVAPATEVFVGDRFETSSQQALSVRYPDGTLVEVDGASSVEFGNNDDIAGKRIFIHRGSLTAAVNPQTPGRPLVIRTDRAEARVLGTQFWLSRQGERTRLDVLEGRVALAGLEQGGERIIESGQFGVLSPAGLVSGETTWPPSREALTFLFQTQDRGNLVREASTGRVRSCRVTPRGAAHLNRHFALELRGGSFVARGVADDLLAACRRTNAFTFIGTLAAATPAGPVAPATIATFASELGQVNFLLQQTGAELAWQLRLRQDDADVFSAPQRIGSAEQGRAVQVALVFENGRMTSYLDGQPTGGSEPSPATLANWEAGHLVFGALVTGAQAWHGVLEGIAVYGRALSSAEIAAQATAYQAILAERDRPAQIEVLATALALSSAPTAGDMAPEEAALQVDHYRVDKLLSGNMPDTEIYVARWAVLDSMVQPGPAVGEQRRLRLEPMQANPQLADFVCRDDFQQAAPAAPRYFLAAAP